MQLEKKEATIRRYTKNYIIFLRLCDPIGKFCGSHIQFGFWIFCSNFLFPNYVWYLPRKQAFLHEFDLGDLKCQLNLISITYIIKIWLEYKLLFCFILEKCNGSYFICATDLICRYDWILIICMFDWQRSLPHNRLSSHTYDEGSKWPTFEPLCLLCLMSILFGFLFNELKYELMLQVVNSSLYFFQSYF